MRERFFSSPLLLKVSTRTEKTMRKKLPKRSVQDTQRLEACRRLESLSDPAILRRNFVRGQVLESSVKDGVLISFFKHLA